MYIYVYMLTSLRILRDCYGLKIANKKTISTSTARVFQAFLNSRNILSVFGSGHPNTEPIRYLFNTIYILYSRSVALVAFCLCSLY